MPALWKIVARAQGVYYALTGTWSLVSIDTFMLVTGPKTDVWLVKTVGVLVIAIGATFLFSTRRPHASPEIRFLAISAAAALAAVETYYVVVRTISPIYALDALVEVAFIVAWLLAPRHQGSLRADDVPFES